MQPTISEPVNPMTISQTPHIAEDLDFLAAKLHARRSRIAEGERLDSLCRIQSLQELFHDIFPESELEGVIDFQRRLIYRLIEEISGFSAYLSGAGGDLLNWTLVRFQVENLKILLRSILTNISVKKRYEFLVPLPKGLSFDIERLVSTESIAEFAHQMPKGLLRQSLQKAIKIYSDYPRSFFFEAALDCGYFEGLIARTKRLSGEERKIIEPIIFQEVDIFHLLLVARGKFHYRLSPEMLYPLHVEGTRIPRALFVDMLNDSELFTSIGRVSERILGSSSYNIDTGDSTRTVDVAAIESQAWGRFLGLSNRAFRQSHMGLGTIMGYVGIRRVEVANLITISEGIRKNLSADAIRARTIPKSNAEVSHV